jgi:hypothetical protein
LFGVAVKVTVAPWHTFVAEAVTVTVGCGETVITKVLEGPLRHPPEDCTVAYTWSPVFKPLVV